MRRCVSDDILVLDAVEQVSTGCAKVRMGSEVVEEGIRIHEDR
jgi:hypothetical protein